MQLLGIAKFFAVLPAKCSSRESRVRGRAYLLGRGPWRSITPRLCPNADLPQVEMDVEV